MEDEDLSPLLKSAYEIARDEKLKRNRTVLKDLGLDSSTSSTSSTVKKSRDTPKKKKEPVAPTRSSKRVKGLGPDGKPVEKKTTKEEEEEESGDEEEVDEQKVMNLKIARLKALHKERKTGYKNPTATYEHTWMRVRTMTDKALANRIKTIERAMGKDCIVKMRMFAEVLVLAEKDELAKEASAALGRLVAAVGVDLTKDEEDASE